MSLLKEWRDHAYGLDDNTPEGKKFWLDYFQREKAIYEQLLAEPKKEVKGTVKELAEKYDMPLEDSEVSLLFDPEKLYMNMVGCNAEWLYTLEQWDKIFTEDKRKELYKIQKSSKTVVKPPKVGRNDPCPCGSGKKFKKCCGANA